MMSIITLTTDFGLKDHFVGALKGKIITEHPQAQIIDISHDIDLFNISEARYIINAAYNNFPKGSVHLIGVDSERTSETKHIAMKWDDHYFVGADNGILSVFTQQKAPEMIVEINNIKNSSNTYSDLDIFVKAACHLAKGNSMHSLGNQINEIKEISELQATVSSDLQSIKGYVVYIDHFGNCVTNISKKLFEETAQGRAVEIKFGSTNQRFKEYIIRRIHQNYSDFNVAEKFTLKDYEGERLALFNESGFLEIAIYKSNPSTVGSAKSLLGLKYRDMVTVQFL